MTRRESLSKKAILIALLLLVSANPVIPTRATGSLEGWQNQYYLPLVFIPSLVRIENVARYAPDQYSDDVLGEVRNLSTSYPIAATVKVVYADYRDDGYDEFTDMGRLVLPVVMPGEVSPFGASDSYLGSYDIERVELIETPYVTSPRYASLEVVDFTIKPYWCEPLLWSTYITGTVQNISTDPVHSIAGVIWDFTDAYQRARFGQMIFDRYTLAPGETTTFYSYVSEPYCPAYWPFDLESVLKFAVIGVVTEP